VSRACMKKPTATIHKSAVCEFFEVIQLLLKTVSRGVRAMCRF
jgi:hypothetical protein